MANNRGVKKSVAFNDLEVKIIKKTIVLATLCLALVAVVGYAGLASALDGGNPGSVNDPLVTRSFVEKYVNEVFRDIGPSGGASFEWEIAELEPGEEFIGTAGTEFIVRSGAAVVVDPSGSGILDLTAGANLTTGKLAEKNHLFSIPRADGRGIQAQKPTIILFRGY